MPQTFLFHFLIFLGVQRPQLPASFTHWRGMWLSSSQLGGSKVFHMLRASSSLPFHGWHGRSFDVQQSHKTEEGSWVPESPLPPTEIFLPFPLLLLFSLIPCFESQCSPGWNTEKTLKTPALFHRKEYKNHCEFKVCQRSFQGGLDFTFLLWQKVKRN